MATSSQLSPVLALVPPQPQTVSTPLTLKANAIWTVLGNGTYATAQWLQLALLARLGTPADVGRYAFATAIATPAFMLFNLQLRSVQATDSQGRYSFPE